MQQEEKIARLARTKLTAMLGLWLLLIAACAPSSAELWRTMSANAVNKGFVAQDMDTPPFRLSALLKNGGGPDLVVYLEGDGRVLKNGRPTLDPSPPKAQGYELALVDPAPSVLYLARIGQFQPQQTGENFQPYWTTKRLSPESVAAASLAIDKALAQTGGHRLHLTGYSGGGGLALLLAERRGDVASLVTVAGLLDTDWWVWHNNYPPLTGSLNPADQAHSLIDLPQIHLYGEEDSLIAPAMSAHFAQIASFRKLLRVGLPTDHWSHWTRLWPQCLRDHVLPLRERASQEWEWRASRQDTTR